MAPVSYHYNRELESFTFPPLLRSVWRRLHPNGEDPVYQVYREHLVGSMYAYRAEAFMTTRSAIGSYSRSSRGGTASTPDQAIQYAAMEALTDLRHQEVEMQTHPGFFFYPTLSPSAERVQFAPDDPTSDRAADHLSRYITAAYLMILSLSEELA